MYKVFERAKFYTLSRLQKSFNFFLGPGLKVKAYFLERFSDLPVN